MAITGRVNRFRPSTIIKGPITDRSLGLCGPDKDSNSKQELSQQDERV